MKRGFKKLALLFPALHRLHDERKIYAKEVERLAQQLTSVERENGFLKQELVEKLETMNMYIQLIDTKVERLVDTEVERLAQQLTSVERENGFLKQELVERLEAMDMHIQLIDTTAKSEEGGIGVKYDQWASENIINAPKRPYSWIHSSFSPGSKYHGIIVDAAFKAESLYACALISELERTGISGDLVEFGVFEGMWLSILSDHIEKENINMNVHGFDSFEGLPSVNKENDLDCWHQGQYNASYKAVSERLKMGIRENIFLHRGWFESSLKELDAQAIDKISFARIDCDLYQSACECLDYLKTRLVDGAILVFDDWTWDLNKGETKAFKEWVEGNVDYRFDFLNSNMQGSLYLRVKKKL